MIEGVANHPHLRGTPGFPRSLVQSSGPGWESASDQPLDLRPAWAVCRLSTWPSVNIFAGWRCAANRTRRITLGSRPLCERYNLADLRSAGQAQWSSGQLRPSSFP